MSVRTVLHLDDPFLALPARPVGPVGPVDDGVRAVIDDLFDTLAAVRTVARPGVPVAEGLLPGFGLAAPQIGVPLRILVYDSIEHSNEDRDPPRHRGALIDPQLHLLSPVTKRPDPNVDIEFCVSLPNERHPVVRSDRVLVHYTDVQGRDALLEASGWLARILQHECDHLDGVSMLDRLVPPWSRIARRDQRRRERRRRRGGEPRGAELLR